VNRHLLRRHSLDRILSVASIVTLVIGVLMMVTTSTGFGGFWGVFLPIFALMSTFGSMQSNTAAGALSIDPLRAGSVAAMLGGSAFGVGAVSSALAGMMHDGSAKPMALIILVSVFGSAWALYGLALPKPAR
jgi:DHA1 family bicyclomycin/chloramphenicol resistance-like MFS transporter